MKKHHLDLNEFSMIKEALDKADKDLKTFHSQKDTLEDRVANLIVDVAPLDEEPEDLRSAETRAEMVFLYRVAINNGGGLIEDPEP